MWPFLYFFIKFIKWIIINKPNLNTILALQNSFLYIFIIIFEFLLFLLPLIMLVRIYYFDKLQKNKL